MTQPQRNFLTLLGIEDTAARKVCVYCEVSKVLADFPRHSHHEDRLDTRCRACIKKHSKLRRELKKTAPPKPERCECCNQKVETLCLDHDHETNTFRGWLCDPCNTGLGKFGDSIEGISKALEYLKRKQVQK